jgi:queuine tRNA-ribosyltransferase accessory subunit
MHSASDYISNSLKLSPDIIIGPADLFFARDNLTGKPGDGGKMRTRKMVDRTGAWTSLLLRETEKSAKPGLTAFVPVLPVPAEKQRLYLAELEEYGEDSGMGGLALHSANVLDGLPASLARLPRLSLDPPASPHEILRQVALGADIISVPFLNTATDGGIALTFSLPVTHEESLPLGIDLWDPVNSTSTSPLSANCTCYTCNNHHKAYIHHLLTAKEMLGWTLLAIHNHHTLSYFFASIRDTLSSQGTIEEAFSLFSKGYERDIPLSIMGDGPRVRGYQYKSERNQEKRNKAPFSKLEQKEKSTPIQDGKVLQAKEDHEMASTTV